MHVICANGEAKLWFEPAIEVAAARGLSPQEVNKIAETVKDREEEISDAWNHHFPR